MSVGATLQQARTERKLSLAQVTEATKIQPWVLEALETDRLQDMMSPIYVKGFLTSYARFLRLAPEPLVAQVRWPKPDPVLEDLPPPTPSAFTLQWPRLSPAVLRRLGAGVAVTAAVGGLILINPLRWLSSLSLPALSLPKRVQTAQAPRAPDKPAAPKLASVTPVREPVSLPTPPPPALAELQPLELAVTAHRTTWIRVRADGKLLTQQRLPRGAQERWTAHKQFELIISKPTQVELVLNGQSISPFAVAHKGRVLITRRGVTPLPNED